MMGAAGIAVFRTRVFGPEQLTDSRELPQQVRSHSLPSSQTILRVHWNSFRTDLAASRILSPSPTAPTATTVWGPALTLASAPDAMRNRRWVGPGPPTIPNSR